MKPTTTPYNGCAAYTKNHIRCSAYVSDPNTCYCPTHKNYARDWFAKHPPLYGLYRPDITRRSRAVKEYIHQFRTEAIIPSRYYVYNLTSDAGNYFYYYLLCQHCPSVDPLWNRRLFKDVLWFQYRRALDNPLYVRKFFEACEIFAKNPECAYFMFNMLLLYSIQYLLENVGESAKRDYYKVYEELWERLFNQPFFGQVALSEKMKEVIPEHLRFLIAKRKDGIVGDDVYNISREFLEELMVPAFETWRQTARASIQSRAIIYSEELIAAAWHPRRVERWVEHYGIDVMFDEL